MSMVVNLWVGELTKLSDKIRLKKNYQPQQLFNIFLKSQTTQNEADDAESGISSLEVEKQPVSSVLLKSSATENELSEETVFWLMDRFAPC